MRYTPDGVFWVPCEAPGRIPLSTCGALEFFLLAPPTECQGDKGAVRERSAPFSGNRSRKPSGVWGLLCSKGSFSPLGNRNRIPHSQAGSVSLPDRKSQSFLMRKCPRTGETADETLRILLLWVLPGPPEGPAGTQLQTFFARKKILGMLICLFVCRGPRGATGGLRPQGRAEGVPKLGARECPNRTTAAQGRKPKDAKTCRCSDRPGRGVRILRTLQTLKPHLPRAHEKPKLTKSGCELLTWNRAAGPFFEVCPPGTAGNS